MLTEFEYSISIWSFVIGIMGVIIGTVGFSYAVYSRYKENKLTKEVNSLIFQKIKTYFHDSKKDYSQIFGMIEGEDKKKDFEVVRKWIMHRSERLIDYANRTEIDTEFLRTRLPRVYQKIIKVIQTNRALFRKSYFEEVQYGFESNTLDSWLRDAKLTVEEIEKIEQEMN